ncbi:unnamed protein product [Rotaria sp. Silwood2]|nr:unnamed protein product [Rotaria sp. Silwood2]CAF4400466.1 unnamed protein product [Rotaria sp. Silwood2]
MMDTVDGTSKTRWDERREIVKIIIAIGCIFDTNGVDVHFLNRRDNHTIKDQTQADQLFTVYPRGYTPLVSALKRIFQLSVAQGKSDKKLLLFIATDGCPTDEEGVPNSVEFEDIMRNKRQWKYTYVSFLLCTDDPECVDYLSRFDRTMMNVDVTDDFKTEREKIRRYQGANFSFSKGDYIVKALVGAIDKEIDIINEPTNRTNNSDS